MGLAGILYYLVNLSEGVQVRVCVYVRAQNGTGLGSELVSTVVSKHE